MKLLKQKPIQLGVRFAGANVIALSYAAVCLYLAQWWMAELNAVLGNDVLSLAVVLFIAIIPGYLNILLLATLYLYKYEPVKIKNPKYPPVSVLIPAYNEQDEITDTFRGLKHQLYPNAIEVVVVNDGSTDRTIDRLKEVGFPNLKVLDREHAGKSSALNAGLAACSHDIVVAMDADTFLHKKAIKRIVARLMDNPNYAAVAGDVLVKNERSSRLARMQAWDYMLGIAAVKRQQGLFRGTLVAQGAFSAFRKKAIEHTNGWRDRLGEDIVLTWGLLQKGYAIGYEPLAFAFTSVPTNFPAFSRQRQRWSRGMIEGFRDHINIIWTRKNYSSFFVAVDLLFPLIDLFYTFVFIPGLILACFGHYHIVGLMTLCVIPLNICIIIMMRYTQSRFLRYAELKIKRNPFGLGLYTIIYQILCSPVCVVGYFKEIFRKQKRW